MALLGISHNIPEVQAPLSTPRDPCESSTRATPFANIHLISATYKRSASTALAGTHHAIGADPRAGRGLFPKPRALVLSMVRFGQINPDGLRHTGTVDSDVMHHQHCLSVLQWTQAQREGTPPTSSQRLVDGCVRLFFKKLGITSLTTPNSSLRTPAIRISPSCSTGTPLSLILRFLLSTKTPQAKVRGAWSYSSFEACCAAPHFLERRLSHFASYTSAMLWLRNVTLPLTFYGDLHGYMQQHNVDFIGGDFNMSAFSTVGAYQEFSAPGNSFLWRLGELEE